VVLVGLVTALLTFKITIRILRTQLIPAIIMERLLLDNPIPQPSPTKQINSKKTEIEIYQRLRPLNLLLKILILMQIELLDIMLLVSLK
jgi:hypothetical protein